MPKPLIPPIRKTISPSWLKRPLWEKIYNRFKQELNDYVKIINPDESEEHHKYPFRDLLINTQFTVEGVSVETSGRADLAVFYDKTLRCLIECKRPGSPEYIRKDDLNRKAFHELVLYYLRERIDKQNNQIATLVATDFETLYIFDSHDFYRLFVENSDFRKQYEAWRDGSTDADKTESFYNDIAAPYIAELTEDIEAVFLDLKGIAERPQDFQKDLIPIVKILSPEHLLRLSFANDANTLDKDFYEELLHIMGLEEVERRGKVTIERIRNAKKRNPGSLLENALSGIRRYKKLRVIPELEEYGQTHEEQTFAIAFELVITWVNRILFLKLLEAQLVQFHEESDEYKFLNIDKTPDYDKLSVLFFEIFALKSPERRPTYDAIFPNLPYLNSSLFEINWLESRVFCMEGLDDNLSMPVWSQTRLQDRNDKPVKGSLKALDYLFRFLDAYNFSSDSKEKLQKRNKNLINSAVLGLVFEKINGYQEGAFFTPGFITTYMAKDALDRAVVLRFSEEYKENFETYDNLKNYLRGLYKSEDVLKANAVFDKLKVCDPSVGSGHFLASSLNQLLFMKFDLGIFADEKGNAFRDFEAEIENDELIVYAKHNHQLYDYSPKERSPKSLRIQLFREKQNLIENCLFGVDINPNSIKICGLRLWIELLKSTYYTPESKYKELQTLPNIDINLKAGDSLVNIYDLRDKGNGMANGKKKELQEKTRLFKEQVKIYKTTDNPEQKELAEKNMEEIKESFVDYVNPRDTSYVELLTLKAEQKRLYEYEEAKEKYIGGYEKWREDFWRLKKGIKALEKELKQLQSGFYRKSLEWRFAFPEVLNDDGKFEGFDLIIGNPPYIQLQSMKEKSKLISERIPYDTFSSTGDIYALFYEKALELLRPKGFCHFITSNKWMRGGYGKELRKFFLEKVRLISINDMTGMDVFAAATVDVNTLMYQKETPTHTFLGCNVSVKKGTNLKKWNMWAYVQENAFETYPEGNPENIWVIESEQERNLKAKIESKGTPLKEWDVDIFFGIKTGLNEAFIIDGATKDKLIAEDPNSEQILKPILRGKDTKKFYGELEDRWILFIPWHFPLHEDSSISGNSYEAEKAFEKQYPAVFEYLLSHKERLLERNTAETGIRYEWYALQRAASTYRDHFDKEKIIWKRVGSVIRFQYDDQKMYCLDSTCIATGQNLKFLTAFLNSKVAYFLLDKNAPKTGTGDMLLSVQALEPLKIPKLSANEQKPFIEIVNQILEAKKQNPQADTSTLEAEIDKALFALYELTEEEIKIIEEAVKT